MYSLPLPAVLVFLPAFALLPAFAQPAPPVVQKLSREAPSKQQPEAASKGDTSKVLVVFGDSISAGYGVPQGRSYPDDLQHKLDAAGYSWRVVNLGVSGDTTQGGVSRMSTAVAARPNMVLLELGGNDGLRGLPLAMTRMNLDQMISTFRRAGAQVVIAGMTLPPNYGMDYVHSFEKIFSDLATKYKLPLIPFIFADIITPDLRYFQPDHIHPTADGAEIISDTVFRTIRPLLGPARN
jgi:acyl-CoA thioesterase I